MTHTLANHIADHEQRPRWWARRQPLTALQLAQCALEEAQRQRLEHKQAQEYHTAMTEMLEQRIVRLRGDVNDLRGASGGSVTLYEVDMPTQPAVLGHGR
jgi:hypothetical protein